MRGFKAVIDLVTLAGVTKFALATQKKNPSKPRPEGGGGRVVPAVP